ncbi:YgiQ family radical SAM protein [uncultured Desulfuromusa sp.]|uniref:YgiQ family radical SAM protein n=1 Tax=uncultured Desulfuromusa sp. TaxID=219183 RepID=UPI002AA7CA89|nr:YgiQ family radical SAM protein [uncultured Desulfuromusa sp.]
MTHNHHQNTLAFLPTCSAEMAAKGWKELDILFISGDAYIDHPTFGTALLARLLESHGFRVGILAQPDWRNPQVFRSMGRPRLFAAISAGAMDSMVNHYTAAKKIRRNDAYTPGGISGKRPNRAVIAYTAAVKGALKGLPTVIGGIEASLRRLAHYDYWSDKVRRSILIDSKADLLIYGMAESALLEIAQRLKSGEPVANLKEIKGTAFVTAEEKDDTIEIPSFEQVSESAEAYNLAFKLASEQENPFSAKPLEQRHGHRKLIINPPSLPLSTAELDHIYSLPYLRKPHSNYTEKIPAFEQIRNSITSHRGCFGGCAFCAITHHQGKTIQSRSPESILQEIEAISSQDGFHGTISDVGGPTANMYGLGCGNLKAEKNCQRASCLFPDICKNLMTDDQPATRLLEMIRRHKKIKHAFVASGIRYDLLHLQKQYFSDLLQYHISGLLKVAPESTSNKVTRVMRKPGAQVFTHFLEQFRHKSLELGLRQTIVPYLISSHPGCTVNDMIEVALYLKQHQLKVEQVQDFTPTPGSLSTCIYHTGKDPFSGQKVHIPRSTKERRLQKALLLYHLPESKTDILEALQMCKREDIAKNLFNDHHSQKRHKRPQRKHNQVKAKK